MILLEGVSKCFGPVAALRHVRLHVREGDRLAILGPSGAGKTTLLRTLAGLEIPDEGRITVRGMLANDPAPLLAPHERGLGCVFQRSALWPHMTVAANAAFGLERPASFEGRTRIADLIRRLELGGLERRKPHELSGGQARRTAIARALAPSPPIVLLDEPFSGLDGDLARRVAQQIRIEASARNMTVILSAHDHALAALLCDESAHIHEGVLSEPAAWEADDPDHHRPVTAGSVSP